jgi:Uma2 family endonuclease
MSRATSVKYTYQDYFRLPDENRYEIIDGDLFLTPAPGIEHQRISARLMFILIRHIRVHGSGEILSAPCDVVLTQTDVVQPDLLFISQERREIAGESSISAAPDLVVEILSKSTERRDRGIKSELYERTGVVELWIVDPWTKRVEIFRRSEGKLQPHAAFGFSETLLTPTFPGLEIPLAEVFSS